MDVDLLNDVPELWRTNIVRIYSYQDKILKGCIYNAYYEEAIEFQNLMHFLLAMEGIQNDMDYPMSAVELRQFQNVPKHTKPTGVPVPLRPSAVATFQVKLLFRQHATWQGTVTWVEGKQQQSFRSALELVHLMDNVLSQATECEPILSEPKRKTVLQKAEQITNKKIRRKEKTV